MRRLLQWRKMWFTPLPRRLDEGDRPDLFAVPRRNEFVDPRGLRWTRFQGWRLNLLLFGVEGLLLREPQWMRV